LQFSISGVGTYRVGKLNVENGKACYFARYSSLEMQRDTRLR